MLGCSKQNISYWKLHSYSTQSRKSIINVINNAKTLFELSEEDAASLAYAAGLSLNYEGGYILSHINYDGKLKELCSRALISDKMLRNYKTIAPSKQAVLAICAALDMNAEETDLLLCKYGYCLSDSIAGDIIVKWHMDNNSMGQEKLLDRINGILDDTGLPLLMSRQKK